MSKLPQNLINLRTKYKAEQGIKCIADGEIVAYRLDTDYHDEGRGKYSTSFFLVRHKIEYPANNKATFFSLYMHTANKHKYNIAQTQTPQTQSNEVYYTVKKGDTLGKIARENHTTIDKLKHDNNIVDVNKIRENQVLIVKTNNPNSSSQTQIPQPQSNTNPNPNFIVENPQFDTVVVLPTPKPINAGETIGLMGEYNQQKESHKKVLHLEVFANETFKTFLQNAKRGDGNLPQSFSWARVIEINSKDHISIFDDMKNFVLPKEHQTDEIKINESFKELFKLIDKDQNGQMESQEISKATQNVEIKKITNKYIVKHSSEWDKKENMAQKLYEIIDEHKDKFDGVDELLKHYENEKERIYNLSFFAQCKNIDGFPKNDMVYVINPIGLVNEFLGGCLLTAEKLHTADPITTMANCEKYIEGFNLAFENYEINTCLKKAHFLAQILHESGHLQLTKEGGNLQGKDYYPYIGRGLMQLTYDYNYEAYGLAVGEDFLSATNMQKLEIAPHASQSAGWFYQKKGLNPKANINDFLIITARINGGFNGFDDRLKILKVLFQEFGLTDSTEYKFNESEVYEDAKLSFAWGLWHDPLVQSYQGNIVGCSKDSEKAKEGYRRVTELLTPSSEKRNQYSIQAHPELASYKDIHGNIYTYKFAKRRLEEL